MSILNASFRLVDSSSISQSKPRLIRLPRAVANELVILSLLVRMAVSDLRAEASERVFATDASTLKGAICSAPTDVEFSQFLWRVSRSKGAYHRMLTPLQAISKRFGLLEELGEDVEASVSRSLAFCYDFIEVFSGASAVTSAMAALGYIVGPPIDLSISEEYNMEWVHVVSWVAFMLAAKRLCSVMCEPPCTSFSLMRRPALRSPYKDLLESSGVSMCRTDSCMFGSIHLKPFRFLGVNVDLGGLSVKCSRDHEHVVVQGSYTKASATYVPRLAERLAETLAQGVIAFKQFSSSFDDPPTRAWNPKLLILWP